jgi:hypothetical protein
MRDLNQFATRRTDRIKEILDIFRAIENFDMRLSLSDDTFNANIRFQRQYIRQHIDDLINSIPKDNKTLDADTCTVSIHINKTNTLVVNMMTREYEYITLNNNQIVGQSTII